MANNNSTLGFEAKLWKTADKLRNNMDATEYKHIVLGLIFLKYISDKFQSIYDKLSSEEYADPEDKKAPFGRNFLKLMLNKPLILSEI